jgi:hypothetical protein
MLTRHHPIADWIREPARRQVAGFQAHLATLSVSRPAAATGRNLAVRLAFARSMHRVIRPGTRERRQCGPIDLLKKSSVSSVRCSFSAGVHPAR